MKFITFILDVGYRLYNLNYAPLYGHRVEEKLDLGLANKEG
jgi:hypothetical protein